IDAECKVIHQRDEQSKKEKFDKIDSIEKTEKGSIIKEIVTKWTQGLTLSGVLNALQGFLELDGAIIVMTTNHLEKLDKALYREGRVNLIVHSDKMLKTDANQLVRKFFGRASNLIRDYEFTAASMEAMCQTARDFDNFEEILRERQHALANSNKTT